MSARVRATLSPDPAPAWLARTLLALGVVSVLALPALTGAFALRLDDAFGITYEPVGVQASTTENGTFSAFRVHAIKSTADQDFWFEEGRAVLALDGGALTAVSVTARACVDADASCVRAVTLLFPIAPRDLAGAWRIDGQFTWLSRDVRVTSGHDVAWTGTGARFDA